jgi:LPS-assembly lipoprotein
MRVQARRGSPGAVDNPEGNMSRLGSILLICVLLLPALGACGYSLRGTRQLDLGLDQVLVVSNGADRLAAELRRQLGYSGVAVAGSVASADAVVTLTREKYDRRVLSVDPDTGKVREFEISFHTSYSVQTADGTVLVDNQPLNLERDLTFDETAVLGKFQEETALFEDLREDAAQTILRRVASIRYH